MQQGFPSAVQVVGSEGTTSQDQLNTDPTQQQGPYDQIATVTHYQESKGLDDSDLPDYNDKEVKRILRKVDWRLPPVLAVLYLLSFLDRSNSQSLAVRHAEGGGC